MITSNSLRISKFGLGAALALFMTMTGATLPTPVEAAPYFEGKTITLFSSRGAGSGATLLTRTLAESLGENIEGNPTVVVKSLTGAAGNRALNFMYEKATRDGTMIIYTPWGGIAQAVELAGIRFKYEDFTPLGGSKLAGVLTWSRKDIIPGGIKSPKDILKAPKVRLGASGITNGRALIANLLSDVLGMKYIFVSGYRGNSKIRAAMLRGEINLTTDAIHVYRSLIKKTMKGMEYPIWHVPVRTNDGRFIANSELTKFAPSFIDLYKSVHGRAPSGPAWEAAKFAIHIGETINHIILGPPNMNPKAAAALRPALAKAMNGPKFVQATQKRFFYAPAHRNHVDVGKVLTLPSTASPEMIAYFKNYFGKRGERAKSPKKKK